MLPFRLLSSVRRGNMALDERSRHELHLRLERSLGPEAAATLMEMLPPTGWADVVTKRDLDLRLEVSEHKLMSAFRGELLTAITAQTRTLMLTIMGSMLTMTVLAFGAAKLV